MQQELSTAIITGLGGMLGWGLADFFAKKTIDRVGPIFSLAWAHLFGTTAFALIALYSFLVLGKNIDLPARAEVWVGLLFFGALQAAVYLLAYIGFGKGQLAVLNPIFASYSGLAALISIVILGEAAGVNRLLALGIIFAGILLLSIDLQGLRSRRINFAKTPGLKEVGFAAVLASIWTLSWDRFVGGQDGLTYALFMYAFMTVVAFIVAIVMKVDLSTKKKSDVWKFLVLIGVCETVAYLSISIGFSVTKLTSVVTLLSGAFSLPTILLARIFLKEKVARVQTIGSLIIIIGIIILSLN